MYQQITRLCYKFMLQKNWRYVLTISNLTRTQYYGTWDFDTMDAVNTFCREWLTLKAIEKETQALNLTNDALILKKFSQDNKLF